MLLTEFDEEKDWAIIAKGHEEIGFEKGIEKGIEKGKEEEKKNMIKKFLSKGKTKEEILDLTDLSDDEYEKLIS